MFMLQQSLNPIFNPHLKQNRVVTRKRFFLIWSKNVLLPSNYFLQNEGFYICVSQIILQGNIFYLCFLIHYDQSEFALMFIQKISSTFRNFNPRIIYKPWPREYKKNVSLYVCAALQMILRKPPLALVKFWCTSLRTEIFILIWSWYC